jgi:gliding motility-associated-like protein
LQGYAFSNLNNYLDWNAFNFQYGQVLNYSLYQSFNQSPYSVIDSADSLSYLENISKLNSPNQQFCYYIIATDSVTYPDGTLDTTTSQSNIICLDQKLTILVPNTIVAGGIDGIFMPKFVYSDINSYLMQIYNRWGGLIFETNNYTQGWNGTYQGQYVEQGVYAYTISVTDANNNTTQSAGTVMVIR